MKAEGIALVEASGALRPSPTIPTYLYHGTLASSPQRLRHALQGVATKAAFDRRGNPCDNVQRAFVSRSKTAPCAGTVTVYPPSANFPRSFRSHTSRNVQ